MQTGRHRLTKTDIGKKRVMQRRGERNRIHEGGGYRSVDKTESN